jgi:predicted RNA-binding protein with PUA-like domain
MKSEPHVYSWQRLVTEKRGVWDGVRNRQASNFLKKMKIGDLAFFYHSVKEKSVVGVCKIVKESYQDPTDETKSWVAVDVEPVAAMNKPVSLEQIKATPELSELKLVRQSRLSVMPIGKAEWNKILAMGNSVLPTL